MPLGRNAWQPACVSTSVVPMTIRLHPRLTAWVAVILVVAWLGHTAAAGASPGPNARLAADGRSFKISAAGFDEFRATWSATVQRDGNPERVLASTEGAVTPGPVTAIRFPDENIELLFQLESRSDARAVMACVGIRNTGTAPVKLLSATPIVAEWKLPANLDGWFLTGFHPATPLVQALREIHQPTKIHEHGGCYHSGELVFIWRKCHRQGCAQAGGNRAQKSGSVAAGCDSDRSRS